MAGPSAGELSFLLTMKDQFSGQFQSAMGQMKQASGSVGQVSKDAGAAEASLGQMAKAAVDAAAAIAGVWASASLANASLDAYERMTDALNEVGRQTDMTKGQLSELNDELNKMDQASGIAASGVSRNLARLAANVTDNKKEIADWVLMIEQLGRDGSNVSALGASFLKIQAITKSTNEDMKKFGDTIAALEKAGKTDINTQQLTSMIESLTEFTAGMKFNRNELAAWGAAMLDLGLSPTRTAMSFQMVLQRIKKDAELAGPAIQSLASRSGMTADAWADMVKNDPSKALEKLLVVVKGIQDAGGDANAFLEKFGIAGRQAQEMIKLASGLDLVKQKQDAVANSSGAAAKMAEDYANRWTAIKQTVGGALDNLQTKIGEALIGKVELAGKALAFAMSALASGLGMLNGIPVFGAMITSMLALGGVTTALAAAWGVFGGAVLTFGARFLSVMSMAIGLTRTLAVLLATQLQAAVVAVMAPIVGFTAGLLGIGAAAALMVVGAVAAFAAIAVAAWYYWDEVKAGWNATVDWLNKPVTWEGFKGLAQAFFDEMKSIGKFLNETKPSDLFKPKETAKPDAAKAAEVAAPKQFEQLDAANRKILEQAESWKKNQEKLAQFTAALKQLRELNDRLDGGEKRSAEELALLEGQRQALERSVNPVRERIAIMNDEIKSAGAVTQAAKDRLEIEQELSKLQKENLVDFEKMKGAYEQALKDRQAARQNAVFENAQYDNTKAIESAKALTQVDRDRLQIAQKIADLKRNSNLSDDQLGVLKQQLEMEKQVANASKLKQAGVDMQDEINALKIVGDYKEADLKTQKQIVEWQRQGIAVSKEMAAAMGDYNRAIQDLQKAQSSGFGGWANSIGSLQDGIMDVQKSFASGLSDSIVTALSGGNIKQAISGLFQNISKQLLTVGVNQMLKPLMAALGADDQAKALKTAQDAKDRFSKAAEGAMQTAIMQVQAGTVNVNGSAVGGTNAMTGYKPGDVTSSPLGAPMKAVVGGSQQENTAWAFFKSKGYGDKDIANIMGNLKAESQWNVNARNKGDGSDGSDSIGLAQWNSQRAVGMQKHAGGMFGKEYGQLSNEEKLQGQLSYVDTEIQSSPRYKSALMRARTADNGADEFGRTYEGYRQGPGDQAAKRGEWARGYEQKYSGQNAPDNVDVQQQVSQAREAQAQVAQVRQQGTQAEIQAATQAQQAKTQADQMTQTSAQTTAQEQQALAEKTKELGTAADQAGDGVQSGANKMKTAGGEVGAAAEGATPSLSGLGGGIGQVASSALSAVPGLGQFSGAIGGLISKLMSGMGGGGGGLFGGLGGFAFNGIGGGMGGVFGGLFHEGGVVGHSPMSSGQRFMSSAMIASAPRYHSGLNDREFPAILEKGERVLTGDQNQRMMKALKQGQSGAQGNTVTIGDINVQQQSTGDPLKDQQHAQATAKAIDGMLNKRINEWTAQQMRPGGVLRNKGKN